MRNCTGMSQRRSCQAAPATSGLVQAWHTRVGGRLLRLTGSACAVSLNEVGWLRAPDVPLERCPPPPSLALPERLGGM
jgi:hypothetical protein